MNRPLVVWSTLAAISLLTAGVAFIDLQAAKRNYLASYEDLKHGRILAAEIKNLRSNRQLAKLNLDSPQVLIDEIAGSLEAAGIDASRLLSVSPDTPNRVGKTEYQRRQTQVLLEGISLRELVAFTSTVESESDATYLEEITVLPAEVAYGRTSGSNAELWDFRLILTQLIYSPKSD